MFEGEILLLNSSDPSVRKSALADISGAFRDKKISFKKTEEVNNHVHTIYSFSPYSPAGAVFAAKESGLQAVGIMDHDTIAGGDEFLEAAALLEIGSTAGFEIRVRFSDTPFRKTRLNNPDTEGIAYMAVHGIPRRNFKEVQRFLAPLREERNKRNRAQTEQLNRIMENWGLGTLDFERDIYAVSQGVYGGTVTERHILFAVAKRMIEKKGKGKKIVSFLRERADIPVSRKMEEYLSNEENPHYVYDLLGVLKSTLLSRFYINPNSKECLSVRDVVTFALSVKGIPAYAYLGDVGDSPTGDKKAQNFEDAFLDDLFPVLKDIGFKAVTFMPPRNTKKQLKRVINLCRKHDFMQISGVDINSSRQDFNCPEVLEDMFKHLNDSTWALIAHEKLTEHDEKYAIIGGNNIFSSLPMEERIAKYAGIGRMLDLRNPVPTREMVKEFRGE